MNKLQDFIKRASERHKNKYDYSKVQYINGHTKVIILCPTHKEFEQTPNCHLNRGSGCSECNKGKRDPNKLLNEFLEKAKQKHGDKYDYNEVVYEGARNNVKIKCKIHNEIFDQTPESHVKGHGCRKCNRPKNIDSSKITQEIFIKKAKEKHGDKYDY